MTDLIATIKADFANFETATENFVIGVVGKIKAGIPVLETHLQSAATWLYNNGDSLLAVAGEGLQVLQEAGLTHGLPQANDVLAQSQSVFTDYKADYTSGTIPESQLVAVFQWLKAAIAAPHNAATVNAPAAAAAPAQA
jgi:hypothetical protein